MDETLLLGCDYPMFESFVSCLVMVVTNNHSPSDCSKSTQAPTWQTTYLIAEYVLNYKPFQVKIETKWYWRTCVEICLSAWGIMGFCGTVFVKEQHSLLCWWHARLVLTEEHWSTWMLTEPVQHCQIRNISLSATTFLFCSMMDSMGLFSAPGRYDSHSMLF